MEENKPIHNEEGKSPPSTDDGPQQNLQLNNPSTDELIVPAVATGTEAGNLQLITHCKTKLTKS